MAKHLPSVASANSTNKQRTIEAEVSNTNLQQYSQTYMMSIYYVHILQLIDTSINKWPCTQCHGPTHNITVGGGKINITVGARSFQHILCWHSRWFWGHVPKENLYMWGCIWWLLGAKKQTVGLNSLQSLANSQTPAESSSLGLECIR